MGGLRSGSRVLGVLGVLLAVIAARVVTSAKAELERGEQLQARGDIDGAILAYRRSARWYAPGNPYVGRALNNLEGIAGAAERDADVDRALAAWRAVRGAAMSTRSFYVPHESRIARADRAIATLTTEAAPQAGRTETQRAITGGFAEPERPAVLWSLLVLLGWLSWTGGAFLFAPLALDAEDKVRPQRARVLGTVVVAGFGLFIVAMALA